MDARRHTRGKGCSHTRGLSGAERPARLHFQGLCKRLEGGARAAALTAGHRHRHGDGRRASGMPAARMAPTSVARASR